MSLCQAPQSDFFNEIGYISILLRIKSSSHLRLCQGLTEWLATVHGLDFSKVLGSNFILNIFSWTVVSIGTCGVFPLLHGVISLCMWKKSELISCFLVNRHVIFTQHDTSWKRAGTTQHQITGINKCKFSGRLFVFVNPLPISYHHEKKSAPGIKIHHSIKNGYTVISKIKGCGMLTSFIKLWSFDVTR